MKPNFLNIILLILFPIFIYSQNLDYQLLIEINEEFLKQDKSFFQNHRLINESLDNRIFIEFVPIKYSPKKQDSTNLNWLFSEIIKVKNYNLNFCDLGVIWFYEPKNYIKPKEICKQGDRLEYKFEINKFLNDGVNIPKEKTAIFSKIKKKFKLVEIK